MSSLLVISAANHRQHPRTDRRSPAIGPRSPQHRNILERADRESPGSILASIADAELAPYWLALGRPDGNPTIVQDIPCDVCVVGGGYTGPWTAILTKERNLDQDVVLIEAHHIGSAASGRYGRFIDASLTGVAERSLRRMRA